MDKQAIRDQVWKELDKVSVPDTRFHRDYTNFIPDFQGSDQALARTITHPHYKEARTLFVTPDNCLETFRLQCLRDNKRMIVTTEQALRGWLLLDPAEIKPEDFRYAACLDGQERVGRPISLRELCSFIGKIDLVATGASVVNYQGIRFGKGHGYFDVEWGVLYSIGVVDQTTHAISLVHDCQVIDFSLEASEYDTVMDAIFTPSRTIEVANAQKPTVGVIWEELPPGRSEVNVVLRELKGFAEKGGGLN